MANTKPKMKQKAKATAKAPTARTKMKKTKASGDTSQEALKRTRPAVTRQLDEALRGRK